MGDTEEVTFNAFVVLLSVMSLDGPLDKKMVYAFRLIDLDDDGRIDSGNLLNYLKQITKFDATIDKEAQEVLLEQAVQNAMAECSQNGLFITMEDFQKSMYVCDDFAQRFTLNLKKKKVSKKGDEKSKYKEEDDDDDDGNYIDTLPMQSI